MPTNRSNLLRRCRKGNCIEFNQPEAHTKRFNLWRQRAPRVFAANDAASGCGGRTCQPLDCQTSRGLGYILRLYPPYTVRRRGLYHPVNRASKLAPKGTDGTAVSLLSTKLFVERRQPRSWRITRYAASTQVVRRYLYDRRLRWP